MAHYRDLDEQEARCTSSCACILGSAWTVAIAAAATAVLSGLCCYHVPLVALGATSIILTFALLFFAGSVHDGDRNGRSAGRCWIGSGFMLLFMFIVWWVFAVTEPRESCCVAVGSTFV